MFLPHVNFQWTVFLLVYEIAHCVAENSAIQYQARNTDGKKFLSTFMFSTLVLGNIIFCWVSYIKIWFDKISYNSNLPISVHLQNLNGVIYTFYLLCYYFPFLYRLLLRAYPQSLLTATRLNVCVLTGGVLMQKVSKIFLNSLEEHSICTLSTWCGNFHTCCICSLMF